MVWPGVCAARGRGAGTLEGSTGVDAEGTRPLDSGGEGEGAEAWCQRPHTEAPWTEPSGGHARPARESWAAAGGAEGCSGAGAAAAAERWHLRKDGAAREGGDLRVLEVGIEEAGRRARARF